MFGNLKLTIWGQATVRSKDPADVDATQEAWSHGFSSFCDVAEANLGTLEQREARQRMMLNMQAGEAAGRNSHSDGTSTE
jgi:hypothetical protein